MHIRRTCCSVAALLTAALCCAGAAGAAQASTYKSGASQVTVVDPPAGDRVLIEAGSRIRSELDAAGLSNQSATCAAGDVGAQGCGEIAAAAAIALSREDGLATIRVIATLPDGYELRRDVRVPPEAGGDDPAVLAVRAVELLRDIYLDVPRAVVPPQDGPPPLRASEVAAVAVSPAGPPSPAVRHLGLALSAAMLAGRSGLGPAVAPMLQVGLTMGRGVTITAAAAGPFGSVEDGVAGGARITEALATAGARYDIGLHRVRPYVTVAAGLHYIRVVGVPQVVPDPMSAALSPLVVAGGGVSVRVYQWMALDAGVVAAFTFPATNVIVGGEVVGRAGAPSVLGQLGLSVVFASL